MPRLPLKSDVFELVDTETVYRHSFGKDVVDAITISLRLEGEVVALIRSDFKTNLDRLYGTSLS